MERISITENIYQYHFTDSKSDFSNSITVLIHDNTAVFFDASYKRHAEKVKNELTESGITEFIVLLSHHHEDHFSGVVCFDSSVIYGADNFGEDHQSHLDDEHLINFLPANHLADWEVMEIAGHRIQPIYTPGHNKCHYSFLIDDKILYAGDIIYFNKAGKPCLPYIDENSWAAEHLESLVKIKRIRPEILISGHGNHLTGCEKIEKEISGRIYYLEKIIQSLGSLPLEECLINKVSDYGGINFHEMNLNRIHPK